MSEPSGSPIVIEEFAASLPEYMTDWRIGGITDPLGQLVSWLWDQISGGLDWIITKVWDFLVDISKTIINALSPVITAVSTFVGDLVKGVADGLGVLSTWITSAINTISTTLGSIGSALASIGSQVLGSISSGLSSLWSSINSVIGSVISTLGNLGNQIYGWIQGLPKAISGFVDAAAQWIANAVKGFIDFWGGVWTAIQSGVSWLATTLGTIGGQIWGGLVSLGQSIAGFFVDLGTTVWNGLVSVGQSIAAVGSQIWEGLVSFGQSVAGFFSDLGKNISSWIIGLGAAISGILTSIGTLGSQILGGISEGLTSIGKTLTTWFTDLGKTVAGIPAAISGFIANMGTMWAAFTKDVSGMVGGIETAVGTTADNIVSGFEGTFGGLLSSLGNILKLIFEPFGEFFKDPIGNISKSVDELGKIMDVAVGALMFALTGKTPKAGQSGVDVVRETVFAPTELASSAALEQIGGLMPPETIEQHRTADSVAPFFDTWVNQANVAFNTAQVAICAAEALSMGQMDVSLAALLQAPSFAAAIDNAREMIKDLYSVSMRQPLMYRWNRAFTPRIPDEETLILALWRIWYEDPNGPNIVRDYLMQLGYHPDLHDALMTKYRTYPRMVYPGDPGFRLVQRGLVDKTQFLKYAMWTGWRDEDASLMWEVIYEPPSMATLFQLYWRGLIKQTPKDKEVTKYLRWAGFSEDMADKVFELSKLIPSISDLIRFAVLEAYPASEEKYKDRLKLPEEHLAKLMEWGPKMGLTPYWIYAHWFSHWRLPELRQVYEAFFRGILNREELDLFLMFLDYNPDVRRGFRISERELVTKMRFTLPTRIQSRWLLRWKVLDKKQYENLYKVLGFGDFIGDNVLKTYDGKKLELRVSDIVEAEYRNALLEERTLTRTAYLTQYKEGLITFNVLVERLTKMFFLEDEIKLLSEKAVVDRETDVYKDYSSELIRGYLEGAITLEELEKELAKFIKDPEALKTIKGTLALRKLRENVSKVRKEADKALDYLLDMYEDGLLAEESAKAAIGRYTGVAKLTKEEINLILEQSNLKRTRTYLKWSYHALLKMLRRGEIDGKKFKTEVSKLGIPEEVINNLVEAEGKYYELSPTNILYYGTYVGIPEEWLKKEMDRIGVPKDHQAIMLAYNKLAPTSDERSKVLTDVIDAYADGYMDMPLLKEWMVKLGKKPEEIEVLATHAEANRWEIVRKLRFNTIVQLFRDRVINTLAMYEGFLSIGINKDVAIEHCQLEHSKEYKDFMPKEVYNYAAQFK